MLLWLEQIFIRLKLWLLNNHVKILNYDETVKINHNSYWFDIPDYPYRILIIGGSESDKTNVLLNLIKHQQPDIDKMSKIDLNQSIIYLLMEEKK